MRQADRCMHRQRMVSSVVVPLPLCQVLVSMHKLEFKTILLFFTSNMELNDLRKIICMRKTKVSVERMK